MALPKASDIFRAQQDENDLMLERGKILVENYGADIIANMAQNRDFPVGNISEESFWEEKFREMHCDCAEDYDKVRSFYEPGLDMECMVEYLRSMEYYAEVRFCATSASTYGFDYGQNQVLFSIHPLPEVHYCV